MVVFSVPSAPVASWAAMGSSNMPHSGLLSATLSGLSFAAVDLTATATLGEATCATASWASGTSVQCFAAASSSGDDVVTVTVSGATGTGVGVFTFDGTLCAEAVAVGPRLGPNEGATASMA